MSGNNRVGLYTRADVSNLLEQFGARPIAFYASFARISGSITAGLMLSQIFFWANHPTSKKDRGWFFKTADKWKEETQLSRSELETARKRLLSQGLIEERLWGNPARLHYRLNLEALASALMGYKRNLSVEEIVTLYASELSRLSALGFNRAIQLGAKAEKVAYVDILRRDGGRCHLCSAPITFGPGRDSDCLTFDHEIPLSRGGEHSAANVKCAHLKCNSGKGNDFDDSRDGQFSLLSDSKLVCCPIANKSAVGLQASLQGYSGLNTGEQGKNNQKEQRAFSVLAINSISDLPSDLDEDAGKALWTRITEHPDARLDVHSYETWLKPVRPLGLSGSARTLFLCVPTSEFSFVAKKYKDLMPADVTVRFAVQEGRQ